MNLDPTPPRAETLELGAAPHRLRDACLISCETGELHVESIDGDFARLGEGDLLRLRLGTGCRLRAVGARARAHFLCAHPGWMKHALGLADDDASLAGPGFCVERAAGEGARRARQVFAAIATASPGEDRRRRLRDAALRLELLALTLEMPAPEAPQGGPRRANPYRAALIRLVSTLRDASLEEVSLASLAREVGLSERQVSRLFRDEFGTSFREHVAMLRLERAKRLLAGTDLPVIEVAGHTGWSSLAHFNSVFRRRVGVTPSAFRAGGISLSSLESGRRQVFTRAAKTAFW